MSKGNDVGTNAVHKEDPNDTYPWVAYLTGRQSAERFLEEAQRNLALLRAGGNADSSPQETSTSQGPSAVEIDLFASGFKANPERGLQRLVALLQASNRADDPEVLRIAIELAEAALRKVQPFGFPALEPGSTLMNAISAWLTEKRKSARQHVLKPEYSNLLLVVIHVSRYRGLLDPSSIWDLLDIALAEEPSATDAAAPSNDPHALLMNLVLSSHEPLSIMQTALRHHRRSHSAMANLEHQVQDLTSRLEVLVSDRDRQRTRADTLNAVNEELRSHCEGLETKVSELEAQMKTTRAIYAHKLDDMRDHAMSTMQGPLARWLQTGLDAVRFTPPRTAVIEERLEEALKLIEREVEWLRHSE